MKDALCKESVAAAPGCAVAWWLMAAYAYYELDDPILTDAAFDDLCRTLELTWDDPRVKQHPHRRLIPRSPEGRITSAAGLGARDYPTMCKSSAQSLLRHNGTMRHIRAGNLLI